MSHKRPPTPPDYGREHRNPHESKKQKLSQQTSQCPSPHRAQDLKRIEDEDETADVNVGNVPRTTTAAEVVGEEIEGIDWEQMPTHVACCLPGLPPMTEEQKRELEWAATQLLPDNDVDEGGEDDRSDGGKASEKDRNEEHEDGAKVGDTERWEEYDKEGHQTDSESISLSLAREQGGNTHPRRSAEQDKEMQKSATLSPLHEDDHHRDEAVENEKYSGNEWGLGTRMRRSHEIDCKILLDICTLRDPSPSMVPMPLPEDDDWDI
jgi:hypothetical protein